MCATCEVALTVLKKQVSPSEAEYLLWNETCFPFDPKTTLRQAKEIALKIKKWKKWTRRHGHVRSR